MDIHICNKSRIEWPSMVFVCRFTHQHMLHSLDMGMTLYDHMMTSSNGNIFRVTGHLCGEFTGHNSPHKGQWHGALMFSFICVWISGWVNSREAGDLIRHRAHYDVTVMNWYLPIFSVVRRVFHDRKMNTIWHSVLFSLEVSWNIWLCVTEYDTPHE